MNRDWGEMTDNDMKTIYLNAGSLRGAAKKLNMDQWKLRTIRDLLGWPVFNVGRKKFGNGGPRKAGASIYDSIETENGLTKEQIEAMI